MTETIEMLRAERDEAREQCRFALAQFMRARVQADELVKCMAALAAVNARMRAELEARP